MHLKTLRFFGIFLLGMALVMCKNHEKISKGSPPADLSPCEELTQNVPGDALLFAARAESKREQVAVQKAENETAIQLVQFFQSEFIEGGQFNIFNSSERLGNWDQETSDQNTEYRKKWSEVSFEMIGSMHNRGSFTYEQDISKDSSGTFTATNVLVVNESWIRNHWEKSLAATDSSLYFRAKESMIYEELMEMDIKQEHPCK